MSVDRRLALVRGGVFWYAALIVDRSTGKASFRVSQFGKTRDAFGQASQVLNLEAVARLVILEGMRARFAPEGGVASSLGLRSDGVSGYRLDVGIARQLGVPSATA